MMMMIAGWKGVIVFDPSVNGPVVNVFIGLAVGSLGWQWVHWTGDGGVWGRGDNVLTMPHCALHAHHQLVARS